METLIIITSILQSLAISLGVGSSTLAIGNFFVAIADGKIDPIERKMMGVVYVVLRVAMGLILLTTGVLTIASIVYAPNYTFTAFMGSVWILIAVLYLNAVLMTLHKMPSRLGPALQASTWYTLGIIAAVMPLQLTHFSYGQFLLGYVTVILITLALVNGTMSYLKRRQIRNQV